MKKLPLLLVSLLLSGCYFAKTKDERPWDEAKIAQVEVGKTTKAEVLQLLGPPKEIVRLLESEAYIYTHTIEKSTGTFLILINLQRTDRQFDAVTVIINRKDVVTAVGSRFSANKARYGFPWQD